VPRGLLYGTPATPKGVASFSPGLLYSATLGAVTLSQSLSATPKEVAAIGALKHIVHRLWRERRNPVWDWTIRRAFPG